MEFRMFLVFIITVIGFTDVSEGQGNGKVYFGALGDGTGFTNTTSYNFNGNAISGELPIYLRISDLTDPTQDVALTDTVDISCEASNTGSGFSRVTFAALAFTTADTPLYRPISFNINAVGRAVDIRCFGVSRGMTCPANTSADATPPQPQFCRSTSISSPLSLSVRRAPTVSFCSPVVIVPNNGQPSYTFSVTLSEPVVDNEVDVHCQVVVSGGLDLSITQPGPVAVGGDRVELTYSVTSRGTPSTVACVAQSQGGGTQYQNSTSTGDSSQAQFVGDTGSLQLLPPSSQIFTNTFRGVLTLDDEADNGVGVKCRAVVADDVAHALDITQNPVCDFSTNTSTTPAPTTPPVVTTPPVATSPATFDPNITTESTTLPTTTPVPIDLSSPWILDNSQFELAVGERSRTVVARRQREVLAPLSELIVMTCCVVSTDTKYFNMSTTMLASANLQPYFCGNCTGGPTSGTETSERVFRNPAFSEVAPCPCDLTYSVCDINCCCDQECTADQRQIFSYCIPGPFGGRSPVTPERMCTSNHTFKDDWFPLMCVEFETNAFLGLFYGNTGSLRTESDFNIRLSQQPTFFSFRENETRYFPYETPSDGGKSPTGYSNGFTVRTKVASHPETQLYPKEGYLSLPDRSDGGACLNNKLVRFMKDRSSQCVHTNIAEMCRADSVFSATIYLEPSTISNPSCPYKYQVLERYGGTNVTKTFVSYYCAGDDTSYVKSSSSYANSVSPTVSHTFSPELNNENCTEPCSDPACLQYNENQETVTSLPPRCAWDDGYTRPPIPISGASFCNNTVVDVRYQFTWQGRSIVSLHASVVLAPVRIPTPTTPLSLTQSFDVKFEHEMSLEGNSSDNYDNQQGAFQRSGKPGYDYGSPLMSGCSSGQEYVDRNFSRQMAVFQPGQNGLCSSATRRPLTFGDDMTSTCKLRLDIDTVNNCTNLRQLVLNHLSVLMAADVVGRQGSNDPYDPTMWVQVLRDLSFLNVTEDNSTDVNATDVYMPIDDVRGICHNITSGVNLVILYGDAGQVNGYPTREVVGARVSYTMTDWQMDCRGGNSARCQPSSTYVDTFLLSSTVTFIKVPASTPSPVIKFYTSKDPSCTSDTCARYYQDFDQSICKYDMCISQLLYPLTKSYVADPPMYTLALSLLAVIFIIGYFMITRPWF